MVWVNSTLWCHVNDESSVDLHCFCKLNIEFRLNMIEIIIMDLLNNFKMLQHECNLLVNLISLAKIIIQNWLKITTDSIIEIEMMR